MSKHTVRFGVVGTGAVARRFAQGVAHVAGAEIAAVWGRNVKTTRELAAFCEAEAALSAEDLFARDFDAVYIATLPDSHFEYARSALRAGKHVLCEKPVMRNVRELDEVLSLARRNGLLFMEAMKPPFFPVYTKLQKQLAEDPIGRVRFVRAGYAFPVPPDHPSWRLDTAGGGIMGIGVYHAFLAVAWLGPASTVTTTGRLSAGGVDSFAAMQTEHAEGTAQLFSGMDLPSPGDALLCGPEGYVTLHEKWWNPERATVHYADGRVVELHEPFVGGGFNYETEHFCALLREGKRESDVMTHQISWDVLHVLDRARSALGVRFEGK
jgi:predicted dehydrogenase